MQLTVYRAGFPTSKYYRGGVWYETSEKGAEYYRRLYLKNNRLIYIHKLEIEINNPFFVEIGNLPEREYPYIAYYIAAFNNYKQITPMEAASAYNNADIVIHELYKEEILDNIKNDKEYAIKEEDTEELFAFMERIISGTYKELGYDSIIFTDEGRFVQIFKFD